MKHAPVLSLVTGLVNRPDSFRRLLNSIQANTSVSFELVVSDASDEPFDVAGLPPNIRIIPEQPRVSGVFGYNRAFAESEGDWVIYLNDDAEVMPGYAEAAIAFMEAHPQIGLGCLHYSENGGPFRVNSSWGVMYGNFGIISRELGNQIGWMDSDLTLYGNDNSLTFRVLLAGKGVTDIPEARILHHSVNDQQRRDNQKFRQRDNDVLTRKYMPLRGHWQSTYHRLKTGTTVPWVHGVNPELVNQ